MSEKKSKVVTIVLLILLIIAVGYIGYDCFQKYKVKQAQEQQSIIQQGAQLGYNQAVTELVELAVTCQTVPLKVNENVTINLIAVECLQQAPAAAETVA